MIKRYCCNTDQSLKFLMIFSFSKICTGTKSKKKGQKILQKNFKIANSIYQVQKPCKKIKFDRRT